MKRPTTGTIGRAVFLSIYPAMLLGLCFYAGGWPGMAFGAASFALLALLLWATTQP